MAKEIPTVLEAVEIKETAENLKNVAQNDDDLLRIAAERADFLKSDVGKCEKENKGYLCFYDGSNYLAYRPSEICEVDKFAVYKKSPQIAQVFKEQLPWWIALILVFLGMSIGISYNIIFLRSDYAAVIIGVIIGIGLYGIIWLIMLARYKSPFTSINSNDIAECHGNIEFYGDLLAKNGKKVADNFHGDHLVDQSFKVRKYEAPNAKDKAILIALEKWDQNDTIPVKDLARLCNESIRFKKAVGKFAYNKHKD